MADRNLSENSRRIARNTVLLYFRMFLLMAVGLYTSRVVLRSLGQIDFGVYGAVAGVVTLFTILTASMSGAISRFITFELGKNGDRLKLVFSTAVSIQLLLAAAIVLLADPIGLWWLNHKMVIPPDRLVAARWVLHFSVLSLVVQLVSVPYNAAIIAHERMDAFAGISIFEGLGKLLVAYLLMVSAGDRLILYAALLAGVSLATRLLYGIFCRRHFEETRYGWKLDKRLFSEMFSFAGWDFIGSGASILRDQGGNQLLNLFYGPVTNGAWLLAAQVNSTVQKFVTSFTTAINPQITKSFAAGDKAYMMELIFKGSRVSVYLLLLVEAVSYTMITAMLATGKIRNYQLLVGGLMLLNFPISWLCLKLGAPASCIYWVAICIAFCCLSARLYMLHGMIGLPVGRFLREVFLNELCVVLTAMAAAWALSLLLPLEQPWGFLVHATASVLIAGLTIFLLGMNKAERAFWTHKLLKR